MPRKRYETRVIGTAILGAIAFMAGATTYASSETAPPVGTWERLAPAVSPSARADAVMSFDDKTGQMLLYGGVGPGGPLGSTWAWDGSNWSKLHPAVAPSPRMGAAMAYDPATGQEILFGGYAPQPGKPGFLSGTWAWDGSNWSHLQPASSPPPLTGAAMAYDPRTRQMILVGGIGANGIISSTWAWDGSNWSELHAATSPPPLYDASLGYSAASGAGQLVLFGGVGEVNKEETYFSSTWAWDGSNWSELSPQTAPTARSGASVAYDPVPQQMVMFGGTEFANNKLSFFSGTWAWDGANWRHLVTATTPPARSAAVMAYDPRTKELVLFGGATASGYLSGTWTYQASMSTTTTTTPPGTTTTTVGPTTTTSATTTTAPTSSTSTAAPTSSPPNGTPGRATSTTATHGTTTTTAARPPVRRGQPPLPHLVVLARNATGDGTVYLGVPAKVYGRIMAQHRWEGRSVLLVRSQAVVVVVVGAKH